MYVQFNVRVYRVIVVEELDDLTNVLTPNGSMTARPRESLPF